MRQIIESFKFPICNKYNIRDKLQIYVSLSKTMDTNLKRINLLSAMDACMRLSICSSTLTLEILSLVYEMIHMHFLATAINKKVKIYIYLNSLGITGSL